MGVGELGHVLGHVLVCTRASVGTLGEEGEERRRRVSIRDRTSQRGEWGGGIEG